jgi:hypothetical protein
MVPRLVDTPAFVKYIIPLFKGREEIAVPSEPNIPLQVV